MLAIHFQFPFQRVHCNNAVENCLINRKEEPMHALSIKGWLTACPFCTFPCFLWSWKLNTSPKKQKIINILGGKFLFIIKDLLGIVMQRPGHALWKTDRGPSVSQAKSLNLNQFYLREISVDLEIDLNRCILGHSEAWRCTQRSLMCTCTVRWHPSIKKHWVVPPSYSKT